MTTLTDIPDITVRESQMRVAQSEASAALEAVLSLPAAKARTRLRFGPGRTSENLARLIDKALVQAEAQGLETDRLVVSAVNAVAAEDIVRIRRKAHGLADWISSPTSDVTIVLRPQGAAAAQIVPQAKAPAIAGVTGPETQAEQAIREALRGVLDPDLGVNIVDFGFVRRVRLDRPGHAIITMTLTSPACPLVKVMTDQMRTILSAMDTDFTVQWEWTPSWRPEDISPAGRDELMVIGFNAF